ncbi:hypothetical protein JIQ42_02129 [Leishmania sp. Namibia]|uniref:hypothetical protein n=1 Tax=Leishmania sp. Namibia TaxID=2802991 RepID=UPI001B6CB3B1|nr:hypothetical protein JIQ42_02129 [Leishmania sp. Namibia]
MLHGIYYIDLRPTTQASKPTACYITHSCLSEKVAGVKHPVRRFTASAAWAKKLVELVLPHLFPLLADWGTASCFDRRQECVTDAQGRKPPLRELWASAPRVFVFTGCELSVSLGVRHPSSTLRAPSVTMAERQHNACENDDMSQRENVLMLDESEVVRYRLAKGRWIVAW